MCVPRWYRYYYVYRDLVSLKSLYTNWTRIVWNWSNWIYRLTAHLALHQPHLRGAVSVQRVRARVRMYVVYDAVVPWSFLLNTGAVRTRPAAPRRCPARHCALCPVSADRGWAAVRRWARSPICSQRCRPRSVGACRTARRACHLQRRVGGYLNTMVFCRVYLLSDKINRALTNSYPFVWITCAHLDLATPWYSKFCKISLKSLRYDHDLFRLMLSCPLSQNASIFGRFLYVSAMIRRNQFCIKGSSATNRVAPKYRASSTCQADFNGFLEYTNFPSTCIISMILWPFRALFERQTLVRCKRGL